MGNGQGKRKMAGDPEGLLLYWDIVTQNEEKKLEISFGSKGKVISIK